MKLSFLVPKQPIFFELFNQLGQKVADISSLFAELSKAEVSQVSLFIARAVDIEHDADEITHEIVNQLNKTFVTPFDREDIYNLAEGMDDIIDRLEDVIQNMAIYHVNPDEKFIADFAEIIIQDGQAIKQLAEMMKKQKYSPEFKKLILQIHDLEDEGDTVYLNFMSELFQNANDPIKVIKLKEMAKGMEKTVDDFQRVSNVFENILVKSQ